MKRGETQQDFASPNEALLVHIPREHAHLTKPKTPEEVLEHHGVKGMRWGVRKEEETSSRIGVKTDETGKIQSEKSALSERKQRKVEKFQARSDIMGTKISELKVSNEALQGTRNVAKRYERFNNKQAIKQLEKNQQAALRNAQAVQQHKLTSTQKKVIVGAVVVGAVAGAVVITRGQQSGAFNSLALRGSAFVRGEKVPFNVNKELSGRMSVNDLLNKVAKPVNPGYHTAGGHMNCRRSTYTYELRRRGFDVHATTSAVGWGQSESGVINALTTEGRDFYRKMSMSESIVTSGASSVARGDTRINPAKKILLEGLHQGEHDSNSAARILKNVKAGKPIWSGIESSTTSSSKRVLEELAKQPNGARGEVVFKFPNFGHSMAYEVVDGVPHIFDSQKGTLYNSATKMVESKWDGFSAAEITRLDNLDLDLKFLTRWATN